MPSSITPSSGWYQQSHSDYETSLDHDDEDDDDVVQAAQPGPDDPREAELLPDGLTLPL